VNRRALLRLAQVAVIAVVAAFIVARLASSWDTVTAYSWRLSVGPLVASVVLFLVFYWLNGLAWWLLVRGVRLRAGLHDSVAVWGQSILARYVPGNVFMFVGRALLAQRRGLALEPIGAAMVYEQALAFAAAVVTAAALFPFAHHEPAAALWGLVGIPVILVALHPRVFSPVVGRLLGMLRRPALDAVLPYRSVLALLALYVVVWLIAGAAAYAFAAGVTDAGRDALVPVTAGYALGFVVGMVAFVFPSGLGVREAVLAATLAGSLPAGVALAWALLLRLWQTVIELVFVGLASIVARLRRGTTPEEQAFVKPEERET
jgi:glycosyltransferase 2 family protein